MKQAQQTFARVLGDEPQTFFRVGFDDETVAMLIELAEECHADPRSLIAAIIKATLLNKTDVSSWLDADDRPDTVH